MGDSLSARAKALITAAEKASIGPWELRREDVIGPQSAKFPHRNPSLNRIHVTSETGPDDGAFIAAARNDAPDIAKAYLEQEQVMAEAKVIIRASFGRREYREAAQIMLDSVDLRERGLAWLRGQGEPQ